MGQVPQSIPPSIVVLFVMQSCFWDWSSEGLHKPLKMSNGDLASLDFITIPLLPEDSQGQALQVRCSRDPRSGRELHGHSFLEGLGGWMTQRKSIALSCADCSGSKSLWTGEICWLFAECLSVPMSYALCVPLEGPNAA